MKRNEVLSPEFKVALEIYRFNHVAKEKIWFNKLVQSLKGKVSRSTISRSLQTLFDWGLVKGEFGETEDGVAGRLLYIPNENIRTIKEIYEKFGR